ncbi:hypothetical protein BJ878DRAFT_560544 [Calycina marina]|uniref:Uncharacterized protein n=1 Tax=Calycina marina TaxID=1763456 RepID=A0A9P7Z6H1_9HELO|nr:hypothetical protein BJ878DRAFT_560544 [Calycina marina]
MAVKALDDSVGPNRLVTTLFVFEAYTNIIETDAPSAPIVECAKALKKATEEIKNIQARRQGEIILNRRNGLNIDAIQGLPIGAPVCVRTATKKTFPRPIHQPFAGVTHATRPLPKRQGYQSNEATVRSF